MQVKKFEAKSMKEALQMVKQELGPEAIILNAKDNKKSYGLAGRGSIEVTAAISEKSLQKKQYTESRLPESSREQFRSTSAKNQRALIETTVTKYQEKRREAAKPSPSPSREESTPSARLLPNRRYIDIADEDDTSVNGRRVDDLLAEFAKDTKFALHESVDFTPTNEVKSLKTEIESLRALLSQYQNTSAKSSVTQHPGAEFGLPFELASSFEKLATAGIDTRYIVEILEQANRDLSGLEKKKKSLVDAWVARYLLSHTSVVGTFEIESNGSLPHMHLFVGSSGHGKTAALIKTVGQMVLYERKKVAVFSTDNLKLGASDQLRIYAQIMHVPFEIINHSSEFKKCAEKYADFDAILVDYPGLPLKDMGEIDHFRALLPPRELSRSTHLVLNCSLKDVDGYEICQRYQVSQFTDILVTKLDESHTHGFLYNVQRKTEKPLFAFGIGPKVPEDFELATRERVLDLIYKLTKS